MTALDRPAGVTNGSVAQGAGARRDRLRDFLATFRTSEYLVVGGSRRFRAVQRRRTRTASRVGSLFVAAAVVLDAVVLLGQGNNNVRAAVALDVAVMVAALGVWWLLPRQLHRWPEAAAFVIMLGVVASSVVSGTLAPTLAAQSVGYLLLFPSLVALVLPWRTTVHLRWLLAFTAIASAYFLTGLGERFWPGERSDLMVVLCVCVGTSLIGHVLLQRGQIRNFVQLERIHSLRRRTEADHRELERVHKELERTARIDPLTGAGNRRRLHEDLLVARSQIDRSGATYGLIELDLDHFKGINDRLGHLGGDDVLRRVVEAVQAATRASDSVYRYGGEEFVVLLPMQDREHLLAAAERLRTAVLDLGIEHPDNASHGVVSVSIGATLIGDETLDQSDEQWFYVVDRAMYAAKAGGRNQVRYATGLVA